MSLPTPFTERFLAGWNPDQNAPQMLVRVVLTVPSALTLYWCLSPLAGASPLVTNPGGFSWQPVIIDGDPIHARGSLLEPGPSLVVTGFTIANERLIPQASGTAADLFSNYVVRGAVVTMWLWHAGLSDWTTDAGQVFKGVIQSASIGQSTIKFNCQQRRDIDVLLPPSKTSKTTEPNAPESSLGIPKPLIYGQFINDGMDEPWLEPYPDTTTPYAKLAQEDVGASGLVVPGILVDAGVGGADGKVIFADHALKLIGNTADQPNVKVAAGSALASLNGTAISADLLTDKSGLFLKDEKNLAYIGIPCIDVRVTGTFPNLALNPRAALDIFDETTYAIVQSTGGATRLSLVVGSVGSPGQMVSAELVIGYRTSHTTTPARARYQRPSSSGADPADIVLTAHTTAAVGEPVIQRIALITGDIYSDPNNVYAAGTVSSDWNTGAGDLLVFLNPATAGHWIHPMFCGLVVKYKPSQSLVAGEVATSIPINLKGLRDLRRLPPGRSSVLTRDGFKIIEAPAVYAAQGQFFANCLGREDTTGDYTGTATELIERPMDIIHHLLIAYGGESAASIETAINKFGSFARARPRNVSVEGNPVTLGVHVGETTQLYPLLSRIAQQAPGWLYLSRFDDKWKFVPWDRRAPVADFPRTLEAADILEGGIDADVFSDTQIVNDVSVGYAYDFFRNRAIHSASVGPASSNGGFASRGKRDQLLKVETTGSGQNNKLDLVRSAVTYAATLNGATYTPAQMMVELKRALVALAVSGATWNAAWGGTVVASHNDRVDFVISATTFAATVAAGGWSVGELAYKIQLAMRAADTTGADLRVGLGMYVLAGVNDALDFNDGVTKRVTLPAGYYRDGAHLARTVQDSLNSQSSNWTCTYNTGLKKFSIGRSSGTATLLWLSGTSAASNCAALLGYAHSADDTGASSYISDYARTRGRIHFQGINSITLKPNTGTNKANGIAVSVGLDQSADPSGLDIEGTFNVQDETFALSEATAFSLPWQSGANAALSIAPVIGWKVAADDAAALRHLADRRRGDRETRCATSVARYGPKETENVLALDVRNTEVAIHLRDTIADLFAEGPIPLRIKTHKLPDLERGRIIAVGDLSSLVTKPPRYGAGAWSGKLFRAIEVAQHWGRAWHQEIVLIEEQSPLASLASTVPDGVIAAVSAFLIWGDNRASPSQAYVQKIDSETGAPEWTANGVVVSAATQTTYNSTRVAVMALPDGGCVTIYLEDIGGVKKLMAQRLSVSGAKLWVSTGVEVSPDTVISTDSLRIISDGGEGYWFGWFSTTNDIMYVRHCNSDGTFATAAIAAGDSAHLNNGFTLVLAPDGSGGLYVVWNRDDGGDRFCGQHINASGTLLWAASGVLLGTCGQIGSLVDLSTRVQVAVLGGDLYIALSNVSFTNPTSIQLRKINASTGATTWTTSNLQPSSNEMPVNSFQIVPSGTGLLYVLWFADVGGSISEGQAQLVDTAGASQWASPVAFASRPQAGFDSDVPKQLAVGSDNGSLIIVYRDPVRTTSDLYALKLKPDGTIPWGPTLIAAHTAVIDSDSIVPDAVFGAVVFYREETTIDVLHAVRLRSDGSIAWGPVAITSGLTSSRWPSDGSSAAGA